MHYILQSYIDVHVQTLAQTPFSPISLTTRSIFYSTESNCFSFRFEVPVPRLRDWNLALPLARHSFPVAETGSSSTWITSEIPPTRYSFIESSECTSTSLFYQQLLCSFFPFFIIDGHKKCAE